MVDELLGSGRYQVLGVDREEKGALFVPYVRQNSGLFRFAKIDLNKDMAKLRTLLTSEQPDYVVNLAALSEVAPSWDHPEQWMQTNAAALTELADILRQLPALKKFVQVSTPEVYGSVTGKIDETAAFNPSTPYAVSKASYDMLLNTFWKNYEFPVVFMRASNVYGAHQQLFKIVPRTIIYLKLNKKLQLHGGGTAVRAYIHVRDVARAYIAGMLRGEAGNVYHVAPDENIEVRELVQRICNIAGADFAKATEITNARAGHDNVYMLDSSKARTEFGWKPEILLESGLRESVNWVDDNWREIRRLSLEYVHQA